MPIDQLHRISFLTSLDLRQKDIAINTLPPILAVLLTSLVLMRLSISPRVLVLRLLYHENSTISKSTFLFTGIFALFA